MTNYYKVNEIVGSLNISPTNGAKLALAIYDSLKSSNEITIDFDSTKFHTSLFFNGLFTKLSELNFQLEKFDTLVNVKNLDGQAIAVMRRSINNGIDIQKDPDYRKKLDDAFIEGMTNDKD